jgi:tRNA A-37 threonylcarbamoyl transferase component Bud32
VCHGDLLVCNTLVDGEANVIIGDFGAASLYHMQNEEQQVNIKK